MFLDSLLESEGSGAAVTPSLSVAPLTFTDPISGPSVTALRYPEVSDYPVENVPKPVIGISSPSFMPVAPLSQAIDSTPSFQPVLFDMPSSPDYQPLALRTVPRFLPYTLGKLLDPISSEVAVEGPEMSGIQPGRDETFAFVVALVGLALSLRK